MNTRSNEDKLSHKYARFVLKFRWVIIMLLIASTVAGALFVDQLDIRNDPDTLLPPTDRYVATNLYGEHTFGMGNLMVWGMKLKDGDIYQNGDPWFINMVQQLHNDVTNLKHSNTPNFIDIASSKVKYMGLDDEGSLQFKRMLPVQGIPTDDPAQAKADLDFLENALHNHPAMESMLVYYEDAAGNKCDLLDVDGKLTDASRAHAHNDCSPKALFIIGDYNDDVKADYLPWIRSVTELVDGYRDIYGEKVEFMTAGEPYFLAYMLLDLVNKAWLFIISLLIVVGVLWYEFRTWQGALLPLLGVGMTIILTLGLMGFTQFKLTTMMVLTPMLLLAIGIGHSVQITRRFMQELNSDVKKTAERAAEVAIGYTMVPATLSIITDMVGFFTLSFVDISFYKAYAYFGMFGMATLLLTTTTLIPLLLVTFTPKKSGEVEDGRSWEKNMGNSISRLLAGPGKWIPVALVAGVMVVSANYAQLGTGIEGMMADDPTPEQMRIQREWDIMPGVEKGVNYSRAAFKDHFMLGGLFGEEDIMIGKEDNRRQSNVAAIHELERLGNIMPGVISVNIPIRPRTPILPECGADAYDDEGERLIGPEICYDMDEDPVQGIFNDASVLAALNEMEEWMRGHKSIGYTGSYVQFVKTVNMIMATPDGATPTDNLNLYDIPTEKHMTDEKNWYAYKDDEDPEYIPSPDDLVQTYNGLLEVNTSAGDLDSFVNTETWDEGIVMGFVNTMDPIATHKVVEDIQAFLVEHENSPGFDKLIIGFRNGDPIDLHVGTPGEAGYRHVTQIDGDPAITAPAVGGFLGATEATRVVAMGEWLKSPLTTALAIFIVAALMFKSLTVAGILVTMLFLTLFSQYGVGGYMTEIKEWSANLAFHVQVALSIAMGLGVDYGIYMISRLREEMKETGGNWSEALRNTLSTTGSAVIVSVIVLLGSFIPLMNTELANTWSVSLYIGEALILDVITALTILPLLVFWLKPKFVFGDQK